MPRRRTKGTARDFSGRFASSATQPIDSDDISLPDDEDLGYLPDTDNAGDDDDDGFAPASSDTDNGTGYSSIDSDDFAELVQQGPPRTRPEYRQQSEEARRLRLVQEMKAAEQREDGNIERKGGAKDKTGKKRGAYKVGGDSERSVRRKLRKLDKEIAAAAEMGEEIDLDLVEQKRAGFRRNGRKVPVRAAPSAPQVTLRSFFTSSKNPPAPPPPPPAGALPSAPIELSSGSDSDVREVGGPSATLRPARDEPTTTAQIAVVEEVTETASPLDLADAEPLPSSEGEAPDPEQVAIEQAADDAAELVEVLEEDMPDTLKDWGKLAAEGLKKARKEKTYKEELFFASLVDLYRWTPRQGRISASLRVAKNHGRGPAFARVVREQARHFEKFQSLKPSRQGYRKKTGSLLDDESVLMGVQRWLRSMPAGMITPDLLSHQLNTVILPSCSVKKQHISSDRARVWLYKLGYRRKRHTKGVYWDGHERKDVKRRRAAYLKEMEEFRRKSRYYEGEEMDTEISPTLEDGEKEHMIYYHDESAYHANDYKRDYWLAPGQQVLKKKEKGRLIMVSDFISNDGRLVLTPEAIAAQELLPKEAQIGTHEARVIIHPSSKTGGDSYWNMDQMIAQVETALKIHNLNYPDRTAVFVFDNSSAHESFAKDALNPTKMNINPGGKNVPDMHDTVIPQSNPHGRGGQPQKMQFEKPLPEDHVNKQYEGLPKGIRIVLEERGMRSLTDKLSGECKACKAHKARKPHLELSKEEIAAAEAEATDDSGDEDERPKDCCLRRIITLQEDFQAEESLLQQIITKAGHHCVFLPKFHPELNPIELYWGWSKRYFRERCNGNFKSAQKLVPESLDACPLSVIRRFIRRVERYESVYRLGATGLAAEYAVKKYRSHRAVRQIDLDAAELARKQADASLLGKASKGKTTAKK